jgi:phosphoglycolate phosphatase-like HAD superfamily hydrolase
MTQILLFDIDGTLISTGGAGRTAFITAFEAETGVCGAYEGFSFAGRTDRGIVRAGLEAAEIEVTAQLVDRVLDHYLHLLEGNVATSDEYVVHPGVHDAVEAVSGHGAAIGLGTGNIEKGARIKLERAGLNPYFGFGGFGCDAEARAELIRAGAERGASKLGLPLSNCDVVVIGDTTRDVAAAHAVGGRCVGVGTGGADANVFERAGAEWFFDSLAHDDAIPHLVRLARGDA